jgi:outer membrane protein TolC
MELAKQAIEFAKRNVAAEQGRFEAGRSTNFDVNNRIEDLKQARLRFARASVDYLEALNNLDYLTGDILPRYGIEEPEYQ